MIFERRQFLAGAAIALSPFNSAAAQILPGPGYGTPLGTSPFAPDVYRARRAQLMAQLKTGLAVIHGATAADAPDNTLLAPFTQNGDFAWLTGIMDEPGAILVLAPGEAAVKEFLFLPSRDIEMERVTVERLPLGSLIEQRTGIQRVQRSTRLGGLVTQLATRAKDLHFLGPVVSATAPVPETLELYGRIAARVPGTSIRDQSGLLTALRSVKEPRELDLMQKAMTATRAGHLAAMRGVKPGMTERQLRRLLEEGFANAGGTGLSYNSIVAAGRNAASLHYITETGPIRDGDLVLIDAAASVGRYACDVTRSFPANGRFAPAQRADYELVLAAQAAADSRLKAGVTFEELDEAARQVFRRTGRIDEFYHGLGHYVGLDVHDPFDRSKPIPAGAVITIEPGLYAHSANQGIRIEDQYLVTATGSERMSAGIPRSVAEIEAAMRGKAG
ncbi:Xaa-Pro peptidase family protein [Sandarakinorhabdus sp.]|uniref:Xaa-Pro peptidase family protein n=1 Tax=Sandarakinorhabdus sp. TaxID=1916663 RepID=UPI00286E2FAD|nr:Xaa-Pro peptidase family protein [Sandarakinorhabdus sp.]